MTEMTSVTWKSRGSHGSASSRSRQSRAPNTSPRRRRQRRLSSASPEGRCSTQKTVWHSRGWANGVLGLSVCLHLQSIQRRCVVFRPHVCYWRHRQCKLTRKLSPRSNWQRTEVANLYSKCCHLANTKYRKIHYVTKSLAVCYWRNRRRYWRSDAGDIKRRQKRLTSGDHQRRVNETAGTTKLN